MTSILNWNMHHPRALDMLGYIPQFISEDDPRTAAEQFNSSYAHGGGWQPMSGWTMGTDGGLKYPGDPKIMPVASAKLREEEIFVYPYAWVAIRQPDGKYEVARID